MVPHRAGRRALIRLRRTLVRAQTEVVLNCKKNILRGGAVVARRAHNPKVVSSNLAPATKLASQITVGLFC